MDGDTIVLMDKTRVRLHGIDTLERDQPYGKEATRALDALIKTKVFVEDKETMSRVAYGLSRFHLRWPPLGLRTLA